MKYLNLACGGTFVQSDIWQNCDFSPEAKQILQLDLLKEFPFKNDSFHLLYSSHFVEHIPKENLIFFLRECFRVIAPGGLLRLVLPDFENIAREYLKNIDSRKFMEAEFNITELIDQCVRVKPGGELINWYHMAAENEQLKSYIEGRTGKVLSKNIFLTVKKSRFKKITFGKLKKYLERRIFFTLINLFPEWIKTYHFSETSTGEKHFWMYDFYSISKSLQSVGFGEIVKLTAFESNDQDFPIFPLDVNEEGKSRKGAESMYIEARKPNNFKL